MKAYLMKLWLRYAMFSLRNYAKTDKEMAAFMEFAEAAEPGTEFMFDNDKLAGETAALVTQFQERHSSDTRERDLHVHKYFTIFDGIYLKRYKGLTFSYLVFVTEDKL